MIKPKALLTPMMMWPNQGKSGVCFSEATQGQEEKQGEGSEKLPAPRLTQIPPAFPRCHPGAEGQADLCPKAFAGPGWPSTPAVCRAKGHCIPHPSSPAG